MLALQPKNITKKMHLIQKAAAFITFNKGYRLSKCLTF